MEPRGHRRARRIESLDEIGVGPVGGSCVAREEGAPDQPQQAPRGDEEVGAGRPEGRGGDDDRRPGQAAQPLDGVRPVQMAQAVPPALESGRRDMAEEVAGVQPEP